MAQQSSGELALANPTKGTQDVRLKSRGSAQIFFSIHAVIYNTLNAQRHLLSATAHRAFRASEMAQWRDAVAIA
jgi:hypothetical protein